MNQLVDTLWLRLPATGRRFWLTAGAVLGDGAYLRRWPPAALAVPGGGFLLGLLLGAVHPGVLYTYSFVVVALMLAVAAQGAAMGLWVWSGYALADLVLTDRSALPGFFPFRDAADRVLDGYLPLLLTYLLLATLLVTGPLLATVFAARTASVVRRSASGSLASPPARPSSWASWPGSATPGRTPHRSSSVHCGVSVDRSRTRLPSSRSRVEPSCWRWWRRWPA